MRRVRQVNDDDDDDDDVNLAAFSRKKSSAARRRGGFSSSTKKSGSSESSVGASATSRATSAALPRLSFVQASIDDENDQDDDDDNDGIDEKKLKKSKKKLKKEEKKRKKERGGWSKKKVLAAAPIATLQFAEETNDSAMKASEVAASSTGYSAADMAKLRAEMNFSKPPTAAADDGEDVDLIAVFPEETENVPSSDTIQSAVSLSKSTVDNGNIMSPAEIEAARTHRAQERTRLFRAGAFMTPGMRADAEAHGQRSFDFLSLYPSEGDTGASFGESEKVIRSEGEPSSATLLREDSDDSVDGEVFEAHSGKHITFGNAAAVSKEQQQNGVRGTAAAIAAAEVETEAKAERLRAMKRQSSSSLLAPTMRRSDSSASLVDQLLRTGIDRQFHSVDETEDEQDEALARWEAAAIRGGGGAHLLQVEKQQREREQQQQQQEPASSSGRFYRSGSDPFLDHHRTAQRVGGVGGMFNPPAHEPLRDPTSVMKSMESALKALRDRHEVTQQQQQHAQSLVQKAADDREEVATREKNAVQAVAQLVELREWATDFLDLIEAKASEVAQLESDQMALDAERAKRRRHRRAEHSLKALEAAEALLLRPHADGQQQQSHFITNCAHSDDNGSEAEKEEEGENGKPSGGVADMETGADNEQEQQSDDGWMTQVTELFDDAAPEYVDLSLILNKLKEFKLSRPLDYARAYVGDCLPQLLAPLVSHELLIHRWSPLGVASSNPGQTEISSSKRTVGKRVAELPFIQKLLAFSASAAAMTSQADTLEFDSLLTAAERSQHKADLKAAGKADARLLSRVVRRVLFPRTTAAVLHEWDPFSKQHTDHLIRALTELSDYGSDGGGESEQPQPLCTAKDPASKALKAALFSALRDASAADGPASVPSHLLRPAALLRGAPETAPVAARLEAFCQRRFSRTCRLLRNALGLAPFLPASDLATLCIELLIDPQLLPYVRNLQAQSPVEVLLCLEQFIGSWPIPWTSGLNAVPPELKLAHELLYLLQRTFTVILTKQPDSPLAKQLVAEQAVARLMALMQRVSSKQSIADLSALLHSLHEQNRMQ